MTQVIHDVSRLAEPEEEARIYDQIVPGTVSIVHLWSGNPDGRAAVLDREEFLEALAVELGLTIYTPTSGDTYGVGYFD